MYFGEEDEEIKATLMEQDPQVDLAVIRFEYAKYIQPLEFADSDQLKKGSFAIALGNPSGYYGSATFGIISYPKRYIEEDIDNDRIIDWEAEYIQHDVAINPGNSGGPLINLQGQIIGINTMKFVDEEIDNMGFSIPSNLVAQIVPLLEQGIKPQRPKLGVQILEIRSMNEEKRLSYNIPSDINYGLLVDSVEPNSPAGKANIKKGDIILYFNGVQIRYTHQLRNELNKLVNTSGKQIEIVVYRDGEEITLKAVF
ncbi:MAG TPA: PDZ domain-containing protein [Acholeplasmataceae bacterium]|nr:PDZ domain-containing protein [Acholeplasmataceae bacterium]